MEQEFHRIAVKREPSEEYLLILPPAKSEPGSQSEEDDTPMQGVVEGCQASPSSAGIMEMEVEQELVEVKVEVKREPSVEYLFILPPASNHKPAPQAQASKIVKTKRARLSRSKKLASSSNVFNCDECPYQTKVKSNLTAHKGIHNKSIECETCEKKFAINRDLKLHQMQHKHGIYATALDETFDCEKCHKSFSSSKYLGNHQRAVHDDREVKCAVCDKIFKNRHLLLLHSKTHVKKECLICHKKVSKQAIARHMRSHSANIHFKCDICGYSTNTKKHLKVHIERIHLLRKLVDDSECREDFCDLELLDKLQLRFGSSATTSEKNFECRMCGKSYVTQRTLKKHKRRVHCEATFECEFCKKAFKTRGNLNEHKASVHLKVSCSICNKKISQRSLKSHMKLHLRGSFECDLCTYKSKQKNWLANHINNSHRSGASKAKKRSSRNAEK